MSDLLEQKLAQLRVRFIDKCMAWRIEIELHRAALPNAEAQAAIQAIAHKIAGSAAMYCYVPLGEVARELDERLRDSDPCEPLSGDEAEVRNLVAALREVG